MQASIIVPSYNSLSTIERCLNALRAQRTRFTYEVIVVDSSDDGTGEFIEANFPEVKLIRLPERTFPGLARNVGIEKSQGRIIVFTDSDCVPESFWLEKMVEEQEKGQHSAIGGSVLNGLPLNPVAWSGYLLEFSTSLPSSPKHFPNLLPTCNVSFQRSIFERYGSFPDVQTMEDGIFCTRLIRSGERLLFHPDIRVRHIFRSRLNLFLRHQLTLGKGAAEARRRGEFSGAWLADHPLRWFLPFVRLCRIEFRLARQSLKSLLIFNLLFPLCVGGLIAWGIGFCASNKSHS
jgi:glycosyltransferase involved in cell wall biosynthesis